MAEQRARVGARALGGVQQTSARPARAAADFAATVRRLQTIELGILHFPAEAVVAARERRKNPKCRS